MLPINVTSSSTPSDPRSRLRRIALVAWLCLTVSAVTTISCFEAAAGRRYADSRARAIHARDVLVVQEALRSRFHSAESCALGYVLTGDKGYLDDYNEDATGAIRLLGDLESKNTPAEMARQSDLGTRVRKRISELDRLVSLTRAGDARGAILSVRAGIDSSAQLSDGIDRLIDRQLDAYHQITPLSMIAYQTRIKCLLADAALLTFTMAIALIITLQQLRLRKRAEELLREEASKLTRLTTIIDATSDFVGMVDARGHILFHNKAMRALLGRTQDEYNSSTFMHETHTEASLEIMQNDALPMAIKTGIWEGEATFRASDGSEVPVSQVLLAHKNPDGTVSHLSTIARDIRQHKRDQAELLEQQRFVEQIAAASPNILYLFDLVKQQNIYCNSRISDVLGYSIDDMQRHDNLFAGIVHPDDVQTVIAGQRDLTTCDDRAVVVLEYRMRHADGDWRWMRSREMVFKRDSEGVAIQTIGVCEDVTDEKRIHDEMVIERHRLATIIEAKRQIIHSSDGIGAAMTLACQHAQAITLAEGAIVEMRDGDNMVYEAASGSHSLQVGTRIPAKESLGAICMETREAMACMDTESDRRVNAELTRKLGMRSVLVVPLFSDGKMLGALMVTSTKPNAFNAGDLHGLSLIGEFFATALGRLKDASEKQALLDERTLALERIQDNEALMRSTFHAIQEGLAVVSADGTVELCNPAAARILEISEDTLVGRNWPLESNRWIRRDGTDSPIYEFPIHVAIDTGVPVLNVILGTQREDRDTLWLLIAAVPLFDKDSVKPTRVVITYSDITARLATEEQLNELATTDGLTGINNHRAFREQLTLSMSRSSRHDNPLALIMLDVDHFKAFNDKFGHPAGDVVLAKVAAILVGESRITDVSARYGGEEFAVILPDTDAVGAANIAERIRQAIENAEWAHRPITVSIGVASFSPDLVDASDFVDRADRALYQAKTQGRNVVCIASSLASHRSPTTKAA